MYSTFKPGIFNSFLISFANWLQMLGSGVFTMVWTAIVAFLIAFLLGSLLGVIRTLPNKPLAFIGNCYVEIFRNIPLIVQLFFWA
ncbi:ABC transporter permease subunit, partial [Acinetobacter baumannii]